MTPRPKPRLARRSRSHAPAPTSSHRWRPRRSMWSRSPADRTTTNGSGRAPRTPRRRRSTTGTCSAHAVPRRGPVRADAPSDPHGGLRAQDAPFLLARAKVNRDLGTRAWAFVRDGWDDLLAEDSRLERDRPRGRGRTLTASRQRCRRPGVLRGPRYPAEPPDVAPGARTPAGVRRTPPTRRSGAGRAVR